MSRSLVTVKRNYTHNSAEVEEIDTPMCLVGKTGRALSELGIRSYRSNDI